MIRVAAVAAASSAVIDAVVAGIATAIAAAGAVVSNGQQLYCWSPFALCHPLWFSSFVLAEEAVTQGCVHAWAWEGEGRLAAARSHKMTVAINDGKTTNVNTA